MLHFSTLSAQKPWQSFVRADFNSSQFAVHHWPSTPSLVSLSSVPLIITLPHCVIMQQRSNQLSSQPEGDTMSYGFQSSGMFSISQHGHGMQSQAVGNVTWGLVVWTLETWQNTLEKLGHVKICHQIFVFITSLRTLAALFWDYFLARVTMVIMGWSISILCWCQNKSANGLSVSEKNSYIICFHVSG